MPLIARVAVAMYDCIAHDSDDFDVVPDRAASECNAIGLQIIRRLAIDTNLLESTTGCRHELGSASTFTANALPLHLRRWKWRLGHHVDQRHEREAQRSPCE